VAKYGVLVYIAKKETHVTAAEFAVCVPQLIILWLKKTVTLLRGSQRRAAVPRRSHIKNLHSDTSEFLRRWRYPAARSTSSNFHADFTGMLRKPTAIHGIDPGSSHERQG
jgi:hypothetical protein